METEWYCPYCNEYLEGYDVTHDEMHDEYTGGCGHPVYPKDDMIILFDPPITTKKGNQMNTNVKAFLITFALFLAIAIVIWIMWVAPYIVILAIPIVGFGAIFYLVRSSLRGEL